MSFRTLSSAVSIRSVAIGGNATGTNFMSDHTISGHGFIHRCCAYCGMLTAEIERSACKYCGAPLLSMLNIRR